jgi:zinc protease
MVIFVLRKESILKLNLNKWMLAAAISAVLSGCAYDAYQSSSLPQGVTLIETAAPTANQVSIP